MGFLIFLGMVEQQILKIDTTVYSGFKTTKYRKSLVGGF